MGPLPYIRRVVPAHFKIPVGCSSEAVRRSMALDHPPQSLEHSPSLETHGSGARSAPH